MEQNANYINPQQVNSSNVLHRNMLYVITLISCISFIFTGFGIIILTPPAFIFSLVYSAIFSREFKKSNAPAFPIYSVALTIVFAYVSLALNFGMFADSPDRGYFAPYYFGVTNYNFGPLFDNLLIWTMCYLIFALIINLILVNKTRNKILLSIVPFTGFALIAIHFLSVIFRT